MIETKSTRKIKALRIFFTIVGIMAIGFSVFIYFYSDPVDVTVTGVNHIKRERKTIYTVEYVVDGEVKSSSVKCSHFTASKGDELQLRLSRLFKNTVYTTDDIVDPVVLTLIAMIVVITILVMAEKGKIIIPTKQDSYK